MMHELDIRQRTSAVRSSFAHVELAATVRVRQISARYNEGYQAFGGQVALARQRNFFPLEALDWSCYLL